MQPLQMPTTGEYGEQMTCIYYSVCYLSQPLSEALW